MTCIEPNQRHQARQHPIKMNHESADKGGDNPAL
jgi:hypothetical protein